MNPWSHDRLQSLGAGLVDWIDGLDWHLKLFIYLVYSWMDTVTIWHIAKGGRVTKYSEHIYHGSCMWATIDWSHFLCVIRWMKMNFYIVQETLAIQYALHRFVGCVHFSSIFSFPQAEVTSSYTGPVCPTCCCWCELCWDQCLQMQYYTKTLTRTSTTDITIAVHATAIPTSIKTVYCSSCRGREIQLFIKHDIYLKAILSIFTWPTLRCVLPFHAPPVWGILIGKLSWWKPSSQS